MQKMRQSVLGSLSDTSRETVEAVKAEAALSRSGSRENDLDTAAAPMETDRIAPRNPGDMEDLD